MSSVTAYRLLKYSNHWWDLKKHIYIFLIEAYLKQSEIEESDWEIFSKIITDISIDLLM